MDEPAMPALIDDRRAALEQTLAGIGQKAGRDLQDGVPPGHMLAEPRHDGRRLPKPETR
jgi:hypothetical protein